MDTEIGRTHCRECGAEAPLDSDGHCDYCGIESSEAEHVMNNALAFMGFETDHNGGRLVRDGGDTLIAISADGEVPRSLEDPVDVWLEDAGDTTGDSVRGVERHPTLAAALLDLYGPIEGEPLPESLAPLREV